MFVNFMIMISEFKKVVKILDSCQTASQVKVADKCFENFFIKWSPKAITEDFKQDLISYTNYYQTKTKIKKSALNG